MPENLVSSPHFFKCITIASVTLCNPNVFGNIMKGNIENIKTSEIHEFKQKQCNF